MTINTQQFPITAINGIIVMIVVAVMNRQLLQIFLIELSGASSAYPGIHFQRSATVTLLPLFPGKASLRNNAIELAGGFF